MDIATQLFAQWGPLQPAAESSINATADGKDGSKKRKRDQHDTKGLLQRPFVIRAHRSSTLQRAQTLSPVSLLPRSELPLSYLEPTTSNASLPSARLFSANIPALDTLGVAKGGATVLIAKLETEQSLYAVERVALGTYAICKLRDWVKSEELRAGALVTRNESWPFKQNSGFPEQGTEWWHSVLSGRDREDTQRTKRKRTIASDAVQLSMEQSKHKISQLLPKAPSSASSLSQAVPNVEPVQVPAGWSDSSMAGPTAQKILEIIRTQYLEALHLSKTSLAYFAKGPLSRARAAFSTENGAALPLEDLIHFLRSSILTLPIMDKKYRETVPTLVKTIPVDSFSDDEWPQSTVPGPRRKQKSRRIKPGKDGLHPEEEDYLSRGWRISDNDSHATWPGETSDENMKRRILRLKVRETELQIIIIMETLALESSTLSRSRNWSAAVDQPGAAEKEQRQGVKNKLKKPQDLTILLDLLIDRLCIWSLSNEENGSASPMSSGKREKLGGLDRRTPATKAVQNGLRDFCAEVIIPFYTSRLPNQCAIINRTLGERSASSQTRPTLAKSLSASTRPLSRPRVAFSQEDMPSARPLSYLSGGPDDKQRLPPAQPPPPKLVRSATAPAVPRLKREESEKPLTTIPSKNSQIRPDSRGGPLKAKRFTQREVDLSAVLNANEAKSKQKKASVEEELKDAITALKRPNRGLAGREFVDSAEKRASAKTTNGKSKSSKLVGKQSLILIEAKTIPVRNSFAPGVQVTATPKGRRKKNIIGVPPAEPAKAANPIEASREYPPSSDLCIPQSIKHVPEAALLSDSRTPDSPILIRPQRQHLLSLVQETPSRKPSRSNGYAMPGQLVVQRLKVVSNLEGIPGELTIHKLPASASGRKLAGERSPPHLKVLETPSKRAQPSVSSRAPEVMPTSAGKQDSNAKSATTSAPPLASTPNTEHGKKSISESLGWNDDDVDDLV
ncbi:MAG: hypothetical protein M1836_003240 [Candelina mexicana]|nr:MAG: hypothetical protein M1836_003240 [Candelina mexicana]